MVRRAAVPLRHRSFSLAAVRPYMFQQWPTLSSPRRSYVFGGFALTALAAFAIRIPFPIGKAFTPLNLQPAFLPQYIFAYLVGHICAATGAPYIHSLYPYTRQRPFASLAISTATMALGLAITSASTLLTTSKLPSLASSTPFFAGGPTLPSAAYALWNELGFLTILTSLVALCERYLNKPNFLTFTLPSFPFRFPFPFSNHKDQPFPPRRQIDLPRYAYATFLLHPLVSTAVHLLAQKLVLTPWLDCRALGGRGESWWAFSTPALVTAAVGTVNVLASWAAGVALVEGVPGVGRWI